mmetsp:Transcript_20655/g.54800  ORF Transcript_20655/g.54800 Transcript_20655/m.54800 type:complete len:248 (-) Transcript_20655:228-971(-)
MSHQCRLEVHRHAAQRALRLGKGDELAEGVRRRPGQGPDEHRPEQDRQRRPLGAVLGRRVEAAGLHDVLPHIRGEEGGHNGDGQRRRAPVLPVQRVLERVHHARDRHGVYPCQTGARAAGDQDAPVLRFDAHGVGQVPRVHRGHFTRRGFPAHRAAQSDDDVLQHRVEPGNRYWHLLALDAILHRYKGRVSAPQSEPTDRAKNPGEGHGGHASPRRGRLRDLQKGAVRLPEAEDLDFADQLADKYAD